MIRYYYTKWKLYWVTVRAIRNERIGRKLRSKITALQVVIAAGFTNEKEFEKFNKRLVENRKLLLDPNAEKRLEEIRNKHFNQWKPKRRFKDSKNKKAQQEGEKRSEYIRVLKKRPLKKNPDDLINPSAVGDAGMLHRGKESNNG